jgi:arylsulfatase
MIAHWPQGIKTPGQWRTRPSHVIDIVPTILELAGGKWPSTLKPAPEMDPALRGQSFLSTLSGDDQPRTGPLWWLHEENKAIRVGPWKAVMAKGEEWKLYDLSTDRAETRSLALQNKQKLDELVNQWQAITDEMVKLRSK